ncbi:hypothetical protein Adt_39593 [Abeliophyllum distichum]|uniref:Uncharacterized protein n=1 Tax=Abeliophyllum distichum TaxID=126358 RepID=A0ABD1Q6K6_9LAMI
MSGTPRPQPAKGAVSVSPSAATNCPLGDGDAPCTSCDNGELFGTFEGFDTEVAKSKKLSEDLKAMSLEKVQLESEKRALQFKLDLVVTKEADMRAKYEIELKVAKECLKQAQDQKKTAEASQKRAEEDQKFAEDQTLTAKTALATANSNTEAKVVEAYRDVLVDTSEYQRLMIIGGEQLVEQIMETHPEWDISFLRQTPTKVPASEAVPGDKRDEVEDQTTPLVVEEGPQCADP